MASNFGHNGVAGTGVTHKLENWRKYMKLRFQMLSTVSEGLIPKYKIASPVVVTALWLTESKKKMQRRAW